MDKEEWMFPANFLACENETCSVALYNPQLNEGLYAPWCPFCGRQSKESKVN